MRASLWQGVDVFCVEEIKYSLLGRGCVVPGITTLLSQLFVKRLFTDETGTQARAAVPEGLMLAWRPLCARGHLGVRVR